MRRLTFPGKRGITRLALAAIVIVVVIVAAVGVYFYNSSLVGPPTPVTSVTQKTTLKVAILLPGQKNDLSWNQAAYASYLKMIEDLNSKGKYNLVTSSAEGLYTSADITPALTSLGSQGYDLVIGDGFQYTGPAIQLSPTYPNTGFLISGGYESAKNVAVLLPATGEAGFILGVLAARLSHTGKVGIIGGEDVSEITWATKGFLLGVSYANQNFGLNVQPINTFLGNFNDPAGAKAAAAADVAQGVDVLYCTGDGISVGVASEAESAHVAFIYNDFNETSLAPDATVGGLSYSIAPIYEQALNDWLTNHTFSALPYYATFPNQGLSLELTSKVPSSDAAVVQTILQAILANKIRVYQELTNGTLVYSPVTPAFNSL
ncbi:MAG: BMP family ABC transporter substrate-binding protein [Candidatus Bathyarchaeia archaeon]|jgi:basic membrane protein A